MVFLRIMNEVGTSSEGFDIIKQMCENCVENRATACEKCATLHKQLDGIEDIMPRSIMMEKYQFPRTKFERDRLLAIEDPIKCSSCTINYSNY